MIALILAPTIDQLFFSLLDMKEGSVTGPETAVTRNGAYTVPSFSGSSVSSLEIRVNDYDALTKMICEHYSGRLVDILDVTL